MLCFDIIRRKRLEQELQLSQADLRRLAAHLESAREMERKSIARDIHDELGRSMTAMKVSIAWLGKRLGDDDNEYQRKQVGENLQNLAELADGALAWVRRITTQLRPAILDDFGLVAALEWQCDDFQKKLGVRCKLHVDSEEIDADSELLTALFRICQESLTNVARHADATRVDVSLERVEDGIVLTVLDNGGGVSLEERHRPGSSGVVGMQERALSVGGQLTIDSAPGSGTKVSVRAPLRTSRSPTVISST